MRARALMAIFIVLSAAPALAEDNPACAKYQQPLDYNACLARQGPPARMVRATPAPRAAILRGRPAFVHAHAGRAHAIFTIR
jgi:hypothetical protein